MKYKYGVAIPLYNPSEKQINNIKSYINSFDCVFIFDNSEPKLKKNYEFSNDFFYITENENKGLPYAFNYILNLEECKNLDFLCTIDQDSIFKKEEIARIKTKIEENQVDFGILAPFVDLTDNVNIHKEVIEAKEWVISSGSFINLKYLYKEKMRYDENYFVDKFEIDFCKQWKEKGYSIFMYYGSILRQKLGYNDGRKEAKYANHSSFRHYYMFRNRFYYNNKWYKGIKKYTLDFFQTAKQIISIIKFEDNKKEKILQLRFAIRDYKKKKMGKR